MLSDESCIRPDETWSESNCLCYSQPETDFGYSICAPKKCPLDDPNYLEGEQKKSALTFLSLEAIY